MLLFYEFLYDPYYIKLLEIVEHLFLIYLFLIYLLNLTVIIFVPQGKMCALPFKKSTADEKIALSIRTPKMVMVAAGEYFTLDCLGPFVLIVRCRLKTIQVCNLSDFWTYVGLPGPMPVPPEPEVLQQMVKKTKKQKAKEELKHCADLCWKVGLTVICFVCLCMFVSQGDNGACCFKCCPCCKKCCTKVGCPSCEVC